MKPTEKEKEEQRKAVEEAAKRGYSTLYNDSRSGDYLQCQEVLGGVQCKREKGYSGAHEIGGFKD